MDRILSSCSFVFHCSFAFDKTKCQVLGLSVRNQYAPLVLLFLKGLQSCLLTAHPSFIMDRRWCFATIYGLIYVADTDPNCQLAKCFVKLYFSCCSADISTVLKRAKRWKFYHMQTCNKIDSEISIMTPVVYCKYQKNCCPQEGSIITFIPPITGSTFTGSPQDNRPKNMEEGCKRAAAYGQFALTSWHPRPPPSLLSTLRYCHAPFLIHLLHRRVLFL